MLDAVVISDVHLGSYVTRTGELAAFLGHLPPTNCLIVNGDLMDSTATGFPEDEVAILDTLQGIHDGGVEVVWLPGNHDPHPEKWAKLLRVTVLSCAAVRSDGDWFYVVHGHQWDHQLSWFPWLTKASIYGSRLLGRFSPRAARWVKGTEKRLRKIGALVEAGAVDMLERRSWYKGVVCGHSHVPTDAHPGYVNDGSWCENDAPTYCTIGGGKMTLRQWGGEA